MNWLDSASISSLATSAFKTAQKKIDKMLEIQDANGNPGLDIVGGVVEGENVEELRADDNVSRVVIEDSSSQISSTKSMPGVSAILNHSLVSSLKTKPKAALIAAAAIFAPTGQDVDDGIGTQDLPNTFKSELDKPSIGEADDSGDGVNVPSSIVTSEWSSNVSFHSIDAPKDENNIHILDSGSSLNDKEEDNEMQTVNIDVATYDTIDQHMMNDSALADVPIATQYSSLALDPSPDINEIASVENKEDTRIDEGSGESADSIHPYNVSDQLIDDVSKVTIPNIDDQTRNREQIIDSSPNKKKSMVKSFVLHSVSHSALFRDFSEDYDHDSEADVTPTSSHPELSFSVVRDVVASVDAPLLLNEGHWDLIEDSSPLLSTIYDAINDETTTTHQSTPSDGHIIEAPPSFDHPTHQIQPPIEGDPPDQSRFSSHVVSDPNLEVTGEARTSDIDDDASQGDDSSFTNRTPTNFSSDIEVLSLPTTHPPSSLCSLCSDVSPFGLEQDDQDLSFPFYPPFPLSRAPLWTPSARSSPSSRTKRRGLLDPLSSSPYTATNFKFLFSGADDPYDANNVSHPSAPNFLGRYNDYSSFWSTYGHGDYPSSTGIFSSRAHSDFSPMHHQGYNKMKSNTTGPILNSLYPPLATHQKPIGQCPAPGLDKSEKLLDLREAKNATDMKLDNQNIQIPPVILDDLDVTDCSSAILHAREQQIMKLFKENMELKEELNTKRGGGSLPGTNREDTTLPQQEEDLREQIDNLREEFARRIADSEKKLLAANRERDNLKKQLKRQQDEGSPLPLVSIVRSQPTITSPTAMAASPSSVNSVKDTVHTAKVTKSTTSSDSVQLNRTLAEKEQIIKELMEEGNKLAKQQLGNSALIKKLRAREKELEGNLSSQSKKNEELVTEVARTKEALNRKEVLEKDQGDVMQQASADLILRSEKITELESKLLETTEKSRSMATALETAYKEIGSLHKSLADKNNIIEESEKNLMADIDGAVADVRAELEKVDEEKRKSLYREISELQNEILQQSHVLKCRDKNHQREMEDLREAIKSSEARCQDLSQNLSGATRPLVRQIDDLQQLINTQKYSWEKVENSLASRLSEAEATVSEAKEGERRWRLDLEQERFLTRNMQGKIKELENDKVSIAFSLTSLQATLAQLTKEYESLKVERDDTRASLNQSLQALRDENEKLTESVASLSLALRRNSSIQQQAKEAAINMTSGPCERRKKYSRRDRTRNRSSTDNSESQNVPYESRLPNDFTGSTSLAILERTMDGEERKVFVPNYASSPSNNMMEEDYSGSVSSTPNEYTRNSPLSITPTNLSDSPPSIAPSHSTTIHSVGSVPVIFEKLEFQLKLKEGELHQLQGELHKLEKSRESMARELVRLTSRCDVLTRLESEFEDLKIEHSDLSKRYNTVLQMYGEKAEEADEMRMDLQDLKVSYRNQIEILIPSAAAPGTKID